MTPVAGADATFQVLEALGRNRRKRRQRGEFLVHGVRPIDAALGHGWPVTGVATAAGRRRSAWAEKVLARTNGARRFDMPAALFDQLADRDEPGELFLVAALRSRSLDEVIGDGPVLVIDRPASPGNLGTLVRSADAFGAAGVVVLGHAADLYDPRAVRASVGSLFALPVIELGGPADLAPWLAAAGRRVVGLDEQGARAISEARSGAGGGVVVVLGNEARGLSAAARALCHELVAIPMQAGGATSLNVAVAGSIALYELTR
ncbi:MAG TPA: TrmH family RNA methyltransferase [Acidimicrobiales bacterium]|nr:TrmH family RNA methyltransferase [Acidimicrobiales bacterium]